MIVTTKKLFEFAYGKFAVGAYNINNLEQTMGLFRGNLQSQAPFIIQISKGARSYTDKRMLEAIIRAADEIFPEAIFAVHLDHGDLAACMRLHRERLLQLGDDRRLGRAAATRTSASPSEWSTRPTPGASRSRPSWASWAASRSTSRSTRRTPTSPTRPRPRTSSPNRAATASRCAIGTSHGAYKFSGDQALQLRRAGADPGAAARLPAGHARLVVGAAGRGRAHQRRRRRDRRGPEGSTRTTSPRRSRWA